MALCRVLGRIKSAELSLDPTMKSPSATERRAPTPSPPNIKKQRREAQRSKIQRDRRLRCLHELASTGGIMNDRSYAYFDPERVGPSTTHKPGRLYAEIESKANNETFWLSYNAGANFLLDKFTATADTSSSIIWRDGTLAKVRESQDKRTPQ